MVFGEPVYSAVTFFRKDGYTLRKVFCDSYSVSDGVLLTLAAAVWAGLGDSLEDIRLVDIALNERSIIGAARELLSIRADILPIPLRI